MTVVHPSGGHTWPPGPTASPLLRPLLCRDASRSPLVGTSHLPSAPSCHRSPGALHCPGSLTSGTALVLGGPARGGVHKAGTGPWAVAGTRVPVACNPPGERGGVSPFQREQVQSSTSHPAGLRFVGSCLVLRVQRLCPPMLRLPGKMQRNKRLTAQREHARRGHPHPSAARSRSAGGQLGAGALSQAEPLR